MFAKNLIGHVTAAVDQVDSGLFYSSRLATFSDAVAAAEIEYSRAIIAAVNADTDAAEGRGADGCTSFWRAYTLMKNEMLQLALAHEAFGNRMAPLGDGAAHARISRMTDQVPKYRNHCLCASYVDG